MPQAEPTDLAARLSPHLDRASDRPLSRQIVAFVWEEVVSGALETGARLPTARQLAIDLGVSPKTVEQAYGELIRLGVASSRIGEGTFVSLKPPHPDVRKRLAELERVGRDAAARAEALGFTVDDLMEFLAELRAARRDLGRPGRSQ